MKSFAILINVLLLSIQANTQEAIFPDLPLHTPEGKTIPASSIRSDGNPMLMVFWNTNSNECCKQIEAMVNTRDEYLTGYHVRVVSVFVADAAQWPLVRPLIAGKCWDMEAYIDINSEFIRRLSIPELPFTILYDSKMSKVCAHIGFCSGSEDLLCKKVKLCLSEMH